MNKTTFLRNLKRRLKKLKHSESQKNATPEDFKPRDIIGSALMIISAFFVIVILLSKLYWHFSDPTASASIAIIGGADGPTSIFLAGKIGMPTSLYAIAATVITITVIYKLIRHFK